ncbi:phosphonate C-P lyase system protein PhnG [Alkalicoccobacillus murimartini]|uniref:Alpha-D-ribose 1-methylphosphonate 5-triphosphate synthase subunit PhnG n=1 Tax=Alkalicoccobacillus murimartini TaxID=171685 RepID=A0ABT9YGH9_9BACI|nr:phosphonate C-P lyase system protein PhnG [Alkalicoccobacillus murimartini]MDQ0206973.1 alpha-D-ribose 1-methylphosphonate 5-triphosphate synthase subunit PhnG [Alkalicoccobacillus murimartini]
MKRHMRTKILVESGPALAAQLADEVIAGYSVVEMVAPRQGLTMVKMRETAKKSLFFIGEALITEAMVEIDGHVGMGMIVGMDEERARHLAIIDAAYQAELPETKQWTNWLLAAQDELNAKQAKEHAQLMKTKVSFDTMDV